MDVMRPSARAMSRLELPAKSTPVALRNVLDVETLMRMSTYDCLHVLGSFWHNSRTSFESRLAKSFKDCIPTRDFEPHISALSTFYAQLVCTQAGGQRFDWLVRVLSSGEKQPEDSRPLALLADILCGRTGARNLTHLFLKTESRPPMRNVKRLSGPDALKGRIQYVLQDLFIRPCELGGSVLLIDDIYNVGASVRVYSAALKRFVGAKKVTAVNLAATRFSRGRDGHGMLILDTAALQHSPGLCQVWLDAREVFHRSRECESVEPPASCEVRFAAERQGTPCLQCWNQEVPKRRWWRVLIGRE